MRRKVYVPEQLMQEKKVEPPKVSRELHLEVLDAFRAPNDADFQRLYGMAVIHSDRARVEQLEAIFEKRSSLVSSTELLIPDQIVRGNFFGSDADIDTRLTHRYDDVVAGIDFWMNFNSSTEEIESGKIIGVDVTASPREIGGKLRKIESQLRAGHTATIKYFESPKVDKLGRSYVHRGKQDVIRLITSLDRLLWSSIAENPESLDEHPYKAIVLEQLLLQLETLLAYSETVNHREFLRYIKARSALETALQNTVIPNVDESDFNNNPSYTLMRTALIDVFGIDVIGEEGGLLLQRYMKNPVVITPPVAEAPGSEINTTTDLTKAYSFVGIQDIQKRVQASKTTVLRYLHELFNDEDFSSDEEGSQAFRIRSDMADQLVERIQNLSTELPLPPENWQSMRSVAEGLGLSPNSLRRHFQAFIKFSDSAQVMVARNTMGHDGLFFSPTAVEQVLKAKFSGISLRPRIEKPVDPIWYDVDRVALELGVSWILAKSLLEWSVAEHPEWKKDKKTASHKKGYPVYHIDAVNEAKVIFADEGFGRIKKLTDQGYMSKSQVCALLNISSFSEFQNDFFPDDVNAVVVVRSGYKAEQKNLIFCAPYFIEALLAEIEKPIPEGYALESSIASKRGKRTIPDTIIGRLITEMIEAGVSQDDIYVERYSRPGGLGGESTRKTRYYAPAFESRYIMHDQQNEIPTGYQNVTDFYSRYHLGRKEVKEHADRIAVSIGDQCIYKVTKGKMVYAFYAPEVVAALDKILPPANWYTTAEAASLLGLENKKLLYNLRDSLMSLDDKSVRYLGSATKRAWFFSPEFINTLKKS